MRESMLKKIVLSLVMVSGLAYSFDDQQREVLDAIRQTEQDSDAPESQVVADALASLVDKGSSLISSGVNAVKNLIADDATNSNTIVEDAQALDINSPLPTDNPTASEIVTPEMPLMVMPTDLTPEGQVRFAAIRNAWASFVDSNSVQFACDMFNPYAHGRAWKAMWQAGFKGALPTLWENHKAVVAGTAVLSTAAATAAYYAHKNGWFVKAKAWAIGLKEQYFVTAA